MSKKSKKRKKKKWGRIGVAPKVFPPALRFTPYAWEKVRYTAETAAPNEMGGFGISSQEDLLLVQDFAIIKQVTSGGGVEFDDIGVADYFDDMVDRGRQPMEFARIWIHTHPFSGGFAADDNVIGFASEANRRILDTAPGPSGIDEDTCQRVFEQCDWAVMFIMGGNEKTYARLMIRKGMNINFKLPAFVDPACDEEEITDEIYARWKEEFVDNTKHYAPIIQFGAMDFARVGYGIGNAFDPDAVDTGGDSCIIHIDSGKASGKIVTSKSADDPASLMKLLPRNIHNIIIRGDDGELTINYRNMFTNYLHSQGLSLTELLTMPERSQYYWVELFIEEKKINV